MLLEIVLATKGVFVLAVVIQGWLIFIVLVRGA